MGVIFSCHICLHLFILTLELGRCMNHMGTVKFSLRPLYDFHYFFLGIKKCVHMPPKNQHLPTLKKKKRFKPFLFIFVYFIFTKLAKFQIQHPNQLTGCFVFVFFKCHFAKYQFSQHRLTAVRNEVHAFCSPVSSVFLFLSFEAWKFSVWTYQCLLKVCGHSANQRKPVCMRPSLKAHPTGPNHFLSASGG